jgi:phage terminase large subunit-like protein
MVSTGLDGSVTGFRAHLAVIDDCIKSRKAIENPEIRRALSDNWRQVLKPVLYEGARAICLGTRFHHNDIHSTDFCEKEGWVVLTQPALVKNKDSQWQSYWPKISEEAYGFTVEFLLDLKRKDPLAFAYQYQQEAIITNELSLDPRLIQRCQIRDLAEYDQLVLGIDLSATANERSDYTAFCLMGRIGDQYHVIDFRQCRSLGNIEKLKLILDILREWEFVTEETDGIRSFYDSTNLSLTLAVETNAYQASMADDIRKGLIAKYGLDNIRVLQITRNRGDKLQHFRGITTLFGEIVRQEDGSEKINSGKLSFNAFIKMEALFDQILNVGATSHDDALDAFVIAATTLKNRASAGVE